MPLTTYGSGTYGSGTYGAVTFPGLGAAADPHRARVQLVLAWPTVTSATIRRIHEDGTVHPVRGADTVPVLSTTGVGWVGYDHEAPLDQTVTYQAASADTSDVLESPAVEVRSGGWMWLTDPTDPAVGGRYVVRDLRAPTTVARRGLLPILGSALPIAVTDVRLAGEASVVIRTAALDDIAPVRALVATGNVLLIRLPGTWGGDWWYASVGDVTEDRFVPIAQRPERRWQMPYTIVARPEGDSAGPVGATYADTTATYPTYADRTSGSATYADTTAGTP